MTDESKLEQIKSIETKTYWQRLNDQSDKISELKSLHAATDVEVRGLKTQVESWFRNLSEEIRSLGSVVHKQRPETNWFAVSMGFIGIVGFVLTMINLNVRPLTETNTRQDNEHLIMDELVRELSKELAYERGRADSMAQQLNDIDNIGSRFRRNGAGEK